MSGGIGQDGELVYALEQYIETPGTSENMRLFIDKLDGIPKLKKNNGSVIPFPTTGDAPSGLDNVHMVYVNGGAAANGDGTIFTPFKTIQDANTFMTLPANDLNTKSYLVSIYPGEYDGQAINLPIYAAVSLIGMGGAGSTILNFDIFITPAATANANYTIKNILIISPTGLAINGAGLGAAEGNIIIINSAFEYNSAFIGADFKIFVKDSGLLGGLINGILTADNCSLIGTINVNIGAKFYTAGLHIANPLAKVNVVGSAQYWSTSMVNPQISYVVGLFDPSGTATYISDNYSYIAPTGIIVTFLKDGYVPIYKSDEVLTFLTNNIHGSLQDPITLDPQIDITASKFAPVGARALMIHTSDPAPVFAVDQFKATTLSVPYVTNDVNYIEFIYLSPSVTLYTIYQQV